MRFFTSANLFAVKQLKLFLLAYLFSTFGILPAYVLDVARWQQDQSGRWPMKLRNIFRMRTIVIAFGAVLLLGASARAQEIENTNWDDGPGAAPFAQPAPNRAADDFNSRAMNSHAVTAAVTTTNPVVTQAAVLSQLSPAEWPMAISLICTALVALCALAETRRRNRHIDVRTGQIGGRDAL
jgi:hypothetical protein